MDLGFTGKVVVLTGAAGGIGRHTAARFAEEGATVMAVDRDEAVTAMMRKGLSSEQRTAMETATPLCRFGHSEEIADTSVYLCSDRASFISGATINVSGGNTRY